MSSPPDASGLPVPIAPKPGASPHGGAGKPGTSERLVVLSSVGHTDEAEGIARQLVERGLAACVTIVPSVVSIYKWKGRVERDEERLLVIKTRRDRFAELREAILGLHPYEVPEIVALPIEAGNEAYLAWIDEAVAGK